MEFLSNLSIGFGAALTPSNLLFCFFGCFLGTAIGVLPGLGPLATIAILLPFTYGLEPLSAIIMLAGVYYGSQYGGSTTAILLNVPGETSSVVTAIDGYQMARQGRGGVALTVAALVSFFAGCVGTLVLAVLAMPLVAAALTFRSPEYFSLMVLGLVGAASLASGSLVKAMGMIVIGLLIGLVGVDINSGVSRFTFGMHELFEGVEFVALAIGMFAIAEIAAVLAHPDDDRRALQKVTSLFPSAADLKRMVAPMVRGTAIGAFIGVLPGAGASISSFGSYAIEKRFSRNAHELGKGALEGVAGPEAANNAGVQLAFAPTLALGIPGSATMALMIGALMIHNIVPGPRIIQDNPELFWGLIASMWIGNMMLLIINLPLIGVWVQVLKIPYHILYPAILIFSCIGVYSTSYSTFPIYVAAFFGVFGYILVKLHCEPAPLFLGLIFGPEMEENFRRSLVISRGDFSVFFTRPISLLLLCLSAALIIAICIPAIKKKRDLAIQE